MVDIHILLPREWRREASDCSQVPRPELSPSWLGLSHTFHNKPVIVSEVLSEFHESFSFKDSLNL